MSGSATQLRDLVWELTCRNDALTRCWLTALSDVGFTDVGDATSTGDTLNDLESVQPCLAKALREWLKRQEKLQPLLEAISSSQPRLEESAETAMKTLLELSDGDNTTGWMVLSPKKDMNTISLESCDLRRHVNLGFWKYRRAPWLHGTRKITKITLIYCHHHTP